MAPVVVFDTNILFSAIGWKGRPYECLERARLGVADGVTSQALLDELVEKLRDKLTFTEEQIADTLADLLGYLRVVEVSERLTVVADDPDDDRVLECAVAAAADFIVTGDRRHLIPLANFRGCAIISAAEFLARVPAT
jgi:putative PIN family toxin of toxin-antitoxin system